MKSLAYSLVSYYFWFRRLILAEYILVLRVYSLFLQMVWYITVTARVASLQLWMRSEATGKALSSSLSMLLLLDMIMVLARV